MNQTGLSHSRLTLSLYGRLSSVKTTLRCPLGGLRGKRLTEICDSCVLIWEFLHRISSSEPRISKNSVKGTGNPVILKRPTNIERKKKHMLQIKKPLGRQPLSLSLTSHQKMEAQTLENTSKIIVHPPSHSDGVGTVLVTEPLLPHPDSPYNYEPSAACQNGTPLSITSANRVVCRSTSPTALRISAVSLRTHHPKHVRDKETARSQLLRGLSYSI
ncbi:hypothetical protein BDR04DRAFT_672318 [Suillus decipiens]|nr:hypothetical protein BDR04DRAFT_672318 [Suillus decipiens]